MTLKGNHRMLRAWNRAMKFGYFTPCYWHKYWYLCDEHNYRLGLWVNDTLKAQ